MSAIETADECIRISPTLENDPISWLDVQIDAVRFAIRLGDYTRAHAVIARVQKLGIDYEPPKEITPDSWISEIFYDVALINRFESMGITRARHLLELRPERLREITTLADRIIEVMRSHFEKPKQPTGPTTTSGVVDWSVPTFTNRCDEYGDIMLANAIANATA